MRARTAGPHAAPPTRHDRYGEDKPTATLAWESSTDPKGSCYFVGMLPGLLSPLPWSARVLTVCSGITVLCGLSVAGWMFEVSQILFRLSRWEIWNMPRKFDQDAKDRVVRLVEDRILAENMSMQAACQAVAPKLGVSWHTARQWTQQARRAGNIPEPVPEDLAAENARLRRENQELRDTNELLKAASAFFASELDPKRRK